MSPHGDRDSSKVVGRRLDSIDLPDGVTIGAVVRTDAVLMAHSDVVIQTDDHVILFLIDKAKISAIERLFSEEFSFF